MRFKTVHNDFNVLIMLGLLTLSAGETLAQAPSVTGRENLGNNAPVVSTPSTAANTSAATTPNSTHTRPLGLQPRATDRYQTLWGVDQFVVRSVGAGELIRFSYRVVNAQKAAAMNDKKATPFLIDEGAHVKLVVPIMDKVGQLRQSSVPETGKTYWMLFSNKGGHVKVGDRVSVEIGKLRLDGLTVQ